MSHPELHEKPSHIIGIGASAGGLEALQELFDLLPDNLGVAYVVVQHLSPDFKSMMDELLGKTTTMPTHQAEEGETLKADTVYLIPAGKLMRIAEGKIYLSDLPPGNRINLPINECFRSLAEDSQNHAVGIILSGTGSDGSRGVQALKEMGAMVIAQDPEEAKFDSMPVNAINTGCVDFVLKIADMAEQIQRFINHPLNNDTKFIFREHLSKNEQIVDKILELIEKRTQLDFKSYKESTVSRRIEHRMSINNKHSLKDYWDYLNDTPTEVDLVKQDLLIGVTQFFRDSEVWDAIYGRIIKPLVSNSEPADHIRIWVPGCSTGEEPYTYAILFLEAMRELGINRNVTVFASDIDQSAVAFAANGVYPNSISSEVPHQFLSSYFSMLDDSSYQVSKALRSMVVFATHNLIQDPPFSNMDIVSCRNTLIYLQTAAQQKVMGFFHFSLKLNGHLVLGTAETPGNLSNFFDNFDARYRIYSKTKDIKIPVTGMNKLSNIKHRSYQPKSLPQFLTLANRKIASDRKSTHIGRDAMVDAYVPPTLITDHKLKLLFSYGDTKLFTTKLRPGHVFYDLSDLLSPELSGQAITAAHQAMRENKSVLMRNVLHADNTNWSIKCFTFLENDNTNPLIAISFLSEKNAAKRPSADVEYDVDQQAKTRIQELDMALVECQKLYREALEELDTTSEELQASNEELMAANEELQSTNEELQSVNEELYTVNAEYQQKISELTDINNDLENLMAATKLAVLFLDEHLNIRRYTQALKKFVNIIDFDINRDFRDLSFRSPIGDLEEMVMSVNSGKVAKLDRICRKEDGALEVTVSPYKISGSSRGIIITISELHEINKQ